MKTYTVKVDENGDKFWYFEDKLHREDGPAAEYADGDKAWYINGEQHRENGPAFESVNGYKAWYINGKQHREDGPAMECADGYKEWYIHGKKLTQEQFNMRTTKNLTPSVKVIEIGGVKYELKRVN
jgi:phage terminase Nu1 subunit (DNA packaging protein)